MASTEYLSGRAAVYRTRSVAEIDRNLTGLAHHLRTCPPGSHRRNVWADVDALLDRRLHRSRPQPVAA